MRRLIAERSAQEEPSYLSSARDVAPERTTAAPSSAEPTRERVWGNDLQHLDVGDNGAHMHFLDMSATDGVVTANGPRVSAHFGQIEERNSESDAEQWGVRLSANLASISTGDDDDGGTVNTPNAMAEASFGDRGFVLEAGGSALDVEGHTRFEDFGDTRLQGATGAQGRFGIRGLIEDTDGDGCDEYGIRLSGGPIAVQATTEGWGCEHSEVPDRS
jgi:hypothetical protein